MGEIQRAFVMEARPLRILLVEDDIGYAKTVRQILADMEVVHASGYEEALDLAADCSLFDCALVDLNLLNDSDGLGRSIIAALKRRMPDFPVAALTAFQVEPGQTLETKLREIGADDIVEKSADPQHGRILRETVGRLLEGDLQPLVSQRIATTLRRVGELARDWEQRLSRAEQWRLIVRRHFGGANVRYLADPLVQVAKSAVSDLAAAEQDLLGSFDSRGSSDLVNRARERLDASRKQHEESWADALSVRDGVRWSHRTAAWLVGLDLTVLVVLAGVALALAGQVLINWKLDHAHLGNSEILLLGGGLTSGVSTAALAGIGQKVHDRVQEAWSGTSDAFKIEELVSASRAWRLVAIALLAAGGFLMAAVAFVVE